MTLARGRVLRDAPVVRPARNPEGPGARLPRGHRVPRDVVATTERAQTLLAEARACATRILAGAEREAAELRLRAEVTGRADASARLAAQVLAQAENEAAAAARGLERSVELARLLAERLLGEELRLDGARVAALARQALREAGGARRVVLAAHPEDAEALRRELPGLAEGYRAFSVVEDPSRTRGSLRIESDVGVLDADLAPQLDRLLGLLRESLVP